jgi:hypothetical protein
MLAVITHGARSRGRWFPRGGAAARGEACGGSANSPQESRPRLQLRCATWSTVAPLLRRRKPRCRHCGPLPEDVASATLYRSSIMRRLWSPGSRTENGQRPHEMKVGRGRPPRLKWPCPTSIASRLMVAHELAKHHPGHRPTPRQEPAQTCRVEPGFTRQEISSAVKADQKMLTPAAPAEVVKAPLMPQRLPSPPVGALADRF